ncbi:hypothetical protein MAR_006612 [Mya arenaria]|uniref:Tyr recombinase domain-containing protein n=1 Tax=Mya arenaria TaxID=6604 RepID=A0ABY7D920_MYAAR|nr:hypothetical protein MAR_006612 [Mya arenaria]
MSITESIKNELSWWIQNLSHQNRQIIHGNPDLIITTDASSFGWGAVSENESIGGRWDDTEIQNHINVLELFAASHALKSFCKTKSNIHVQIRSDNSCTVAYICHMGGKIEQLNNIAKHMWLWSKDRAIWLSATHVPGIANEADFSSRHFNENVEWKLAESVFSEAVNCFGLPEIDMFASRLNRQLDRFVSWEPDPDAEAVDAFSVCGTSNSESEAGQSRGLAGGTFLDNTEFFHQYSGNVDSRSIHSESGPGHIEITTNIESASFSQQTTSNAMSYIRRSYEKRNLSEKSINIIMASWRKTTQKQYSTNINRWIHFCREREIDPLQTPIEYCIEFLTELYDLGLSYATLNTARSALSSLCKKQDGYNVGSHPLVIRFLSGVYNLGPTKPKYKETWDVSKVLCYLKTLTPARQLSLKMLSYKLVMLKALTQASRSHSISLLTLDNMMKDSVSYSRKGKVNPILKLNRYTLDIEICVYSTIAEYIEQTSGLRNGVRQLIITYIKPHKPVVSTTISRWIKFVLKLIDIDKYSSHSTRSAASSKVKASGLPISEIMKVAGWSIDTTFARFYDKPLERESCCSFQDDIAAALSLSEAKGSPVSGPLASLTDKNIDKTMEDKKRNDLADKYPVSENVTKLNPPKVNPEIWRIIEAKTRSKDVKLQKIQQFTLRAMVPIMQVIDSLVAGRDCQESLNFDELVTKLVDAVALTAVGNADANVCGRESIKRDLNEEYQAICSNTNPVTQMLFGDNITDQLKSITESNKIGFKVRAGKFRQTPYAKDRTFRKSGSFLGQRPYPPHYPQTQRGRGYSRGVPHRGQSKTVYACTIEFIDTPNQTHVRETKLNSNETIVLDREIKGLLLKGVIETAEHCDGDFISTVF